MPGNDNFGNTTSNRTQNPNGGMTQNNVEITDDPPNCSEITKANGEKVFTKWFREMLPERLKVCGRYINELYYKLANKTCQFDSQRKNATTCKDYTDPVEKAYKSSGELPNTTSTTTEKPSATTTTLGIGGAIYTVTQLVVTPVISIIGKTGPAKIADAGVKLLTNATTNATSIAGEVINAINETSGENSLAPAETNEPSYNYNQLVGIYGGLLPGVGIVVGVGLCGVYWSYKNRPRTSIAYAREYASMLKETNSSSV